MKVDQAQSDAVTEGGKLLGDGENVYEAQEGR